jgi:hypothetical protein
VIYFIEAQGMVKIGVSNNPRKRLLALATGCPVQCTLVGIVPGDRSEEASIHERFKSHRVHGEWFRFDRPINDYLRENALHLTSEEAKKKHPLTQHLKDKGESLKAFSERINMSRMQLYRIMNGESTTTDTLRKISDATDGVVPMSAFLPIQPERASMPEAAE